MRKARDVEKLCDECGGKCCQTLLIKLPDSTPADIEFAQTRGIVRFGHQDGIPRLQLNSPCRFVTAGGKCSIYSKRPVICQNYAVDGVDCRFTRKGKL